MFKHSLLLYIETYTQAEESSRRPGNSASCRREVSEDSAGEEAGRRPEVRSVSCLHAGLRARVNLLRYTVRRSERTRKLSLQRSQLSMRIGLSQKIRLRVNSWIQGEYRSVSCPV